MKALLMAALLAGTSAIGSAQNSPAGNDDLVQIITSLGPLANSLVTAISMDRPENGSVVFTRPNQRLMATFFGPRQFVKDDGRQCASFAQHPASLTLGLVDFGKNYTMSIWIKLPAAGDRAVIWDGLGNTPLFLQGNKFMCAQNNTEYTIGTYDPSITGWHHVAITCDGSKTSVFLDGVSKGAADIAVAGKVNRIGAATFSKGSTNSQCGLLDDMFIFDRTLTQDEVGKLFSVRLPMHEPQVVPNAGAVASPSRIPPSPPFGFPTGPNSGPTTFPGLPNPGSGASSAPPAFSTAAAELVKNYRNSLVFVNGTVGAGSGFLATLGTANYVFSNAHVVAGIKGAGFKTLEGTVVKVGGASVAVGHDIFLLQTDLAGKPFEIMKGVEENTSIGDEVVVLGNAEGAGVINTIMGRIVGVGPQLVEVDAAFVPGNSGSPIIHLKTGKVIGVATYLTIKKIDPATRQAVRDPVVRRFGYRLDSVKAWQPVNWQALYAQAAEMDAIEKLTDDLGAFLTDLGKDARVSRGAHTNPAIKNRIDAWIEVKSRRLSPRDSAAADQSFISFLKVTCQTDITAARQRLTYDYFQRQLTEQQQVRGQMADIFGKIITELQKER